MEPSKDNAFCWYPFTQLALKQWDSTTGIKSASPCCNAMRPEHPDPLNVRERLRNHPHELTAKEIFNGPEMAELRTRMLRGERTKTCNTCWKMEDSNPENPKSYRLSSTPGWLTDQDNYIDKPELAIIDFAFGENCNLRCRICGPGLSNKLKIDYKYFIENDLNTEGVMGFDYRNDYPETSKERILSCEDLDQPNYEHNVRFWSASNNQWNNILDNIESIRAIKATGGETLLTAGFIEFMDRAIERDVAKNITLEFHTNATKFNTANIKRLNQFGTLNFNLSIDSIYENYHYMRYPMVWSKLDASLRNMLNKVDKNRIHAFSFNPVVSALNAHYLIDLLDYQIGLVNEYQLNRAVFYVDLLWPERKYTNIKFLSTGIKKDLIKLYEQHIDIHRNISVQLYTVIDFLKLHQDYTPTEQDRLDMLREITLFDKSRNQCYNDYLHPDIIEFLETPL